MALSYEIRVRGRVDEHLATSWAPRRRRAGRDGPQRRPRRQDDLRDARPSCRTSGSSVEIRRLPSEEPGRPGSRNAAAHAWTHSPGTLYGAARSVGGRPRCSSSPRSPCLRPPRGSCRGPRLARLLRDGIDGFTTLVCAPAGSGKTSLRRPRSSVAMPRAGRLGLARRPATTSPAASGARCSPSLRAAGAVPAGLRARRPRPAGARVAARRSCRCWSTRWPSSPEPVVLVLDDVHVLRSRECLAQLAFLVLHAPARCGWCSARADPRCRCTSCACAGSCRDPRRDLAFTEDEAAALLARARRRR